MCVICVVCTRVWIQVCAHTCASGALFWHTLLQSQKQSLSLNLELRWWPAILSCSPVSASHNAESIGALSHAYLFNIGAGDLNSGPYACAAKCSYPLSCVVSPNHYCPELTRKPRMIPSFCSFCFYLLNARVPGTCYSACFMWCWKWNRAFVYTR